MISKRHNTNQKMDTTIEPSNAKKRAWSSDDSEDQPQTQPPPLKHPKSTGSRTFNSEELELLKSNSAMGGSNPGGVYCLKEHRDGPQWYIKHQTFPLKAENEALASQLYRAAGIRCLDVKLGWFVRGNAKERISFTDMIQIKSNYRIMANKYSSETETYRKEVQEGLLVDMWLANWDAVQSNNTATMITTDEKPHPIRVDTGGALLFRAMGNPKPAFLLKSCERIDIGNPKNVPEIENLPAMNSLIFNLNDITNDTLFRSWQHLNSVSDDTIDQMVDQYISIRNARERLKSTLKQRKYCILLHFHRLIKERKDGNVPAGFPEEYEPRNTDDYVNETRCKSDVQYDAQEKQYLVREFSDTSEGNGKWVLSDVDEQMGGRTRFRRSHRKSQHRSCRRRRSGGAVVGNRQYRRMRSYRHRRFLTRRR